MDQVIRDFPEQFAYNPVILNATDGVVQVPQNPSMIVVCGMGGSALPAEILKMWRPGLPMIVHRNYGLPAFLEISAPENDPKDILVVASSYSGNTEETLSAYDEARKRGLPLAAIAVGGKLIEKAKQDKVPYIQIPDTGIQPRMSLGFIVRALCKLVGENDLLEETQELVSSLDVGTLESLGKKLAEEIRGKIPVIYASLENYILAYDWKIKFNETGKIPAMFNVFPELNHNEMTGFDREGGTKNLSEPFHFILLKDQGDHPRLQKRMEI
ncbi:MAG: SIS domain-containing protein, partial [Candidatus Liptonbacteria bacterium]